MVPTFNHLLQAIRRRTPRFRVNEGEWVPRQIYAATSPPAEWSVNDESKVSNPDPGNIIILEDDEDVRVWMAASVTFTVLRLCVVFHQVDPVGNQTPPPTFRSYLPTVAYQTMEGEIQLGKL